MGTQPPGPRVGQEPEFAFYQAVEDGFCRLRGTPFLFSPKDFHLLQQWWRDRVPLAAVLAGMAEVFARRQERQEGPVSSLSYCRHAVTRHARRLAASRVGSSPEHPAEDPAPRLAELACLLRGAAERWHGVPELAGALLDLANAVASLPATAPLADLDATLARLEQGALAGMADLLPEERRRRLEEDLQLQLAGVRLEGEVGQRTRIAVRLRSLRDVLGLPRLELG